MTMNCLPPDVTPRENRVHGAIDAMLRAMRQHHRLVEQRVGSLGLHRSQHRLLMTLSFAGPAASQRDIAEKLGISPAAVARTLKALEAEGLVAKAGGADSRCNEISILPEGQRRIDATHSLFRDLDNGMFEGVADEEIAALAGTLEKLRENLARMEAEQPEKGMDERP